MLNCVGNSAKVAGFGMVVSSLFVNICIAETGIAEESLRSKSAWNGTVAFGPMVVPQYTGGGKQQTLLLPLLEINYNDIFYVEVQRVGIYVLTSEDKKIGVAVVSEPRLGFKENDGAKLRGIATRRNSLEMGITFDADFDTFALSAAWLTDVTGSSRGASTRFSFYRPLVKNNRGEVGLLATADRLSARTANYFFGVKVNEETTLRPRFIANSGTNISIGAGGTYRSAIDDNGAFIFGANIGRLSSGLTRSPLVETSRTSQIYLGYGWAL